jgi:hypothetical protein
MSLSPLAFGVCFIPSFRSSAQHLPRSVHYWADITAISRFHIDGHRTRVPVEQRFTRAQTVSRWLLWRDDDRLLLFIEPTATHHQRHCVIRQRPRGQGNCRRYRKICQRPVRRDACAELRQACLNKDQLGERGEGNCRRYRETCRGRL